MTDNDESLIDEGAKFGSPGLAQALRSLRRMWDNGVSRTEYDNPDHGIANEVLVLTNEGTQAYRHIPLLLDMMEAYEPGVTGLPADAIKLPSARLSFIEAWAEQLEQEHALYMAMPPVELGPRIDITNVDPASVVIEPTPPMSPLLAEIQAKPRIRVQAVSVKTVEVEPTGNWRKLT